MFRGLLLAVRKARNLWLISMPALGLRLRASRIVGIIYFPLLLSCDRRLRASNNEIGKREREHDMLHHGSCRYDLFIHLRREPPLSSISDPFPLYIVTSLGFHIFAPA